jgi:hypothetical protein
MRRVGLAVGILAVLAGGVVALAGGQGTLPVCDGSYQGSLDAGAGAGFASREEAAAHALGVSFDVDVGDLVLEGSGGALFKVAELEGTALESPPTVAIERTAAGYVPTGVLC